MRPAVALLWVFALTLVGAPRAAAQEPPPAIGLFVIDVIGTFPKFPSDQQLAQSRGLGEFELPGTGLGLGAGVHLYLLRWRAITFGLGGEMTVARSHSSELVVAGQPVARAVTERFTSIAPQLSLNFGTGNGWSYISGGIGSSIWSIVPDEGEALPADQERLKTINYGGGARWFLNPHFAFHVDARFYAIDPGTPEFGLPGSPRTTLLVAGAGVSIK